MDQLPPWRGWEVSRAVSQVTLAWPRPKASTGCQNLAFLGHDQNHKLGPQTPTHEPRVWPWWGAWLQLFASVALGAVCDRTAEDAALLL